MFKSIDIELNSDCNLRCHYCPNRDHYRGQNYMPESMFLKIIDELAEIDFSGRVTPSLYGEPLLHPSIVPYMYHVRELLPKATIVMFTNGVKLDQEMYDSIVDSVDQFRVTKHADYDITAAGGKMFVRDFNQDVVLSNRCGLIDHPQAKSFHKACWGLTGQSFINYKGDFLLCCNDFHGEKPFGNVGNDRLVNLWAGYEFNKIKSEMKEGHFSLDICQRCNHVRY